MGFSADLAKEAANITKANETVVRRAAIALFSRVSIGTPVGNPSLWKYPAPPGYTGGTARANWFPSTSSPVTTIDLSARDEGSKTAESIASFVQSASYTGTFRITNNVPYIERLEDGWSTQAAPGAMVKLNVLWMEQNLKKLSEQVYREYGIKP